MRKIIFFLMYLCCWHFLSAQSHDADSLKSLLTAHPQQDTIRVQLLNNLAREFSRNNPKRADSLLDVSLALSSHLNDLRGKGFALAVKGAIRHNVAEDSLAYKYFDESKQI